MIFLMSGDGNHSLCLDSSRAWHESWLAPQGIRFLCIQQTTPKHPGGGDGCFKKIHALLGVMAGAIEGELLVVADSDWVCTNRKAELRALEDLLGDKDILCAFHPAEHDAINGNRSWMNMGFFAVRNTKKMRQYFADVWTQPALGFKDLPKPVYEVVSKWYERRWTKTDEMRVSTDVYNGVISAAELPILWNVCWKADVNVTPDKRASTPINGKSVQINGYHWAYEPDKETVSRHMRRLINKLG